MSPALLLRTLEDMLEPVIEAEGGRFQIAATPDDALGLLRTSPDRWRAIINWGGSTAKSGTYGTAHTGRLEVIVQTPKGLARNPGKEVYLSTASGGLPLLDRVEQLNSWIRAIRYYSDDELTIKRDDVDCKGYRETDAQWLLVEGIPVRSYQTTLAIDYCNRVITATPTEQLAVVYSGAVAIPKVHVMHVEHAMVNATAGTVTVTLPAGALTQRAAITAGVGQLTATDSTTSEVLETGVTIDRSAQPLTNDVLGAYGETDVVFPSGTRGMVGYTALSNLGAIVYV